MTQTLRELARTARSNVTFMSFDPAMAFQLMLKRS